MAALLVTLASAGESNAFAQDDQPLQEGPDPTRLDVERLPPEAIEVTRDLYSHGFFVEGWVGGRWFLGGVGRLSHPGLYANVGFGLEIFRWLSVKVSAEGSIHETNAPAPPTPGVFELLGALAELRLTLPFTARFALWGGAEAGVMTATGDILQAYGLSSSDEIGFVYGASGGLDWHMVNRHHSIGVMGGARLYPTLNGFDGEIALGVHIAAYIRYVF